MKYGRRDFARLFAVLVVCLSLCACGGSPWRYYPGAPERPVGLVATAGSGRVSLNWSEADNAESYNVYYATSPGVTAASGIKIADIPGTSTVVPGLDNNVRYYFAVSAANVNGATGATAESSLSEEVSGIPELPGPFRQSDLQGTWRFNALVSGAGARWMRGSVAIDAFGAAGFTSFLDSTGATAAPAGLFGTMTILPDGTVSRDGAAEDFHGVLSANLHKDMMVATSSAGGTSRMMLVLQKVVAGIAFSAADIKGTGRLVAGPLPYVYHQLSSGASSEWEHASCQVGQDQAVTYLSLNAQTPRQLPGNGSKVVTLSITGDGIVTEAPIPGIAPQPAALMTQGVMSADKMTIVGTATDTNGASVLRVIQLVHPPAVGLTPSSYLLADLAGWYGYHALAGGASPLWGYGSFSVGASGSAAFSLYRDASGSTILPATSALVLDRQGMLADASDPSYDGQLSYARDMVVATRTDAEGAGRLSISLKTVE